MNENNSAAKKQTLVMPLIIIGVMFFAIGFALGINSYLIPLLKQSLNISSGESYMVLAATFSAFLIFGYPASLVIGKIGYKKTMALSFLMFATGFYLYLPSAKLESLSDPQARALMAAKTSSTGSRLIDNWRNLGTYPWPVRLKLIWSLIFPRPSYMRYRYNPQPRWLWPLYYFYRWGDMVLNIIESAGRFVSQKLHA